MSKTDKTSNIDPPLDSNYNHEMDYFLMEPEKQMDMVARETIIQNTT